MNTFSREGIYAFPFSLCRILILISASTCEASFANTDKLHIYAAPAISHFSYQEFDDNKTILNRESGLLAGLTAATETKHNSISLQTQISLLLGTVDYAGYDSNGNWAYSDTATSILEFDTRFSKNLLVTPRSQLWAALTLGNRLWRRDIKSIKEANGILEYYNWPHLGLSLGSTWRNRNSQYNLSVNLHKTMAPRIFVDFKNHYESVDFPLGNIVGFSSVLSYKHKDIRFQPDLAVFIKYWTADKSDNYPVPDTTLLIHEPASTTISYGFRVSFNIGN